ncbi:MAG: DUF4037 domain-containing protein [Clostridiales bacterium]|nr:DUF4037 domain-containing protein [Clostridiales bacterium]
MNGMDISRAFWEEEGLPGLKRAFPSLLPDLAAGLVGEGSECFGYDDAISRDHDWGPGFCLWLSAENEAQFGEALRSWYAALPAAFSGYDRRPLSGRINVFTPEGFFARFIGRIPSTAVDWLRIPEEYLAVCTNGSVFYDPSGQFSALLNRLRQQPDQVTRKKLAARCVTMMQAGQYNLPRCLKRGEELAAMLAIQDFARAAASCVFLLNGRYMPFYKWLPRALRELPLLGAQTAGQLERILANPLSGDAPAQIEALCAMLADALRARGYTTLAGSDMQAIGLSIQAQLTDPSMRQLPVLAG